MSEDLIRNGIMGRKNDNNKKNTWLKSIDNEKLLLVVKVALIVALAIIMFYPPYLQGLFFEKHILPTAIFVFSVFILFCIYKLLKNDYMLFKTPIDYIALGFVVIYFISISVAVHTRSAIIELIKYCMYCAVFYMVSEIADNLQTKRLFLSVIVASSVGTSIIGLDSTIGSNFVRVLNNLFNTLGVKGDIFFGLFIDNNIHSTLQYSNAMASYVMATFFIVVGLLLVEKRAWKRALYGVAAYILALTFMLTHSTGAILIFPVALVIFIIVSPKKNRTKSVVYAVLLPIPAVVVSFLATPYLSIGIFSKRAFAFMLAGLAGTAALSLVLHFMVNLLQGISWKAYAAFAAVVIIALPFIARHMIQASVPLELSHTVNENDGYKIVEKDIALTPGRKYILRYNVEAKMQDDKPYAYAVNIDSKSRKNILFDGSTVLVSIGLNGTESESNGENDIQFTVPTDSNLVTFKFINYFSGTYVLFDNVRIIDAETEETVNKITLKNRYKLGDAIAKLNNVRYDRSGLIRIVFYIDGLRLFKDHWLLGKGGGAWEYLYRQYQSYNYQSSQAHNYPLQVGIETGIFGILILLCLIVFLVYIYKQYYKTQTIITCSLDEGGEKQDSNPFIIASVVTAIASLFIHSVIDFDFSESAMLLMFWQLIAVFNAEVRHTLTFTEMVPFYNNKRVRVKQRFGDHRLGIAGVAVSIIVSVILLVFSVNFVKAAAYAKKAYDSVRENRLEEAINEINEAIRADKYNEKYVIGYNPIPARSDIKAGLADILLMKQELLEQKEQVDEKITQTETAVFQRQHAVLSSHLQRIEKSSSNNLNLNNNLASYYFRIGRINQGIEYLNQGTKLFPLGPTIWYSKVNIYYQIMSMYFNQEDYETAEKYLSTALGVIDEVAKVNGNNLNPFSMNEDSVKILQKMQFMEDNWNDVNDLTKINKIIHYTITDMDVNLDGIPDQWMAGNSELLTMNIKERGIGINTRESSYIYTRYPLKLEKGKKYTVEVKLDRHMETVAFEIAGVREKTVFDTLELNRYIGEFTVDNEPNENGDQLRVYFGSDCVIENIIVVESN